MHRASEHLKLFSFNVEGLKPKLEDPNFLETIQDYDISILTETWKNDPSKINIEGFWDYSQVQPKHKNAIRHSGNHHIYLPDITSDQV